MASSSSLNHWQSPLAPLFSALLAACSPSDGGSASDSSTSGSSATSCNAYYSFEILLTAEEYALWSMGIEPPEDATTTAARTAEASTTDASTSDASTTAASTTDASTTDASTTGASTSVTTGMTLDDMQICAMVCAASEMAAAYETGLSSCSIEPNASGYVVTCKYPATCGGRTHLCVRSRGDGEGPDAGAQWLARAAHDEAASVHAFAALADELARWDAPSELLTALAEAARDEQRHAALTSALARRRGAAVCEPTIVACPARELKAIAVENAVEGCVHETWAALVAAHQARAAADPELRAVFAGIAADETRHAELAWAIDAWLLGQLDDAARAEVAAARQAAVRRLIAALTAAPDQAEVLALGVPSARTAAQLCAGLDAALWSQAA